MPRHVNQSSRFLQVVPLFLLVVIAAGIPRFAAAQAAEPPAMTATRLSDGDRIVLDGRLTEEAWQRAMPASGFRQQDPNTGDSATEPTEVRVLYDARRILIGVICFDS